MKKFYSKKDTLFQSTIFGSGEFNFNEDVVAVFDDMIDRSVPHYQELQRHLVYLSHTMVDALGFAGNIYDCGCSTGATAIALAKQLSPYPNVAVVGMDASASMLEAALKKAHEHGVHDQLSFKQSILESETMFPDAVVIIANLVMQFLPIGSRLQVLKTMYNSLKPGGALLLVEKTVPESSKLQKMYRSYYHEYKRAQGYSQQEVDAKEKALQNVLMPLSVTANLDLLKKAGFQVIEPFYQWFNFVGWVAIK